MDLQPFKAAVLDMDGVITRTATVHARAWKRAFDEFFQRRPPREGESHEPFDADADYRQYVDGKPRYDGVASFLESRGIDLPWGDPDDDPGRETVCGLGNRKNELFQELLCRGGVEVYDDAVEQIAAWKRNGWKIAVISSSRNCPAVLQAANLLDRFDAKVDGNDLERLQIPGKPAPDMFLHAARQLGVRPQETILVEDAIAGIQAGRAGGFGLVVGVARDGPAQDLQQAGADLVVDNLSKLPGAALARVGDGGLHPGAAGMQTSKPSALKHRDQLAERWEDKRLALFLDYDGTLTPIVRRAEEAALPESMRSLLGELGRCCTVAIVSGRDRRDAENMVQLDELVYAGSHGFDIRGPGGLEMQHEEAQQFLPELDEAERQLRACIADIDGARVERKRFAVAVHYREASDEGARQAAAAVDEVCRARRGLRKKGGKKVLELQPDVEWDKGRAVMWLADALGLHAADTAIMYIGDDVTDEDAFVALQQHEAGIGIRVAAADEATAASYSLRDCDEVEQFLQWLLAALQENKSEE